MFGVIDFWAYFVGAIFIVLLPGPNSLYVLAVAARQGARKAYLGALGIFVGDTILMSLTVAGAASVLHANAQLFAIFKLAGAAYLAWIGVKLLHAGLSGKTKAKVKPTSTEERPHELSYSNSISKVEREGKQVGQTTDLTQRQYTQYGEEPRRAADKVIRMKWDRNQHEPFTKALLISLLNPKAIFFFLSFFIQFVDPNYAHPFVSFAILGLTVQIISIIYLSFLIFAGVRLASLFQQRRWLAASAQSIAGILFIGFGLKLAV